MVLTLVISALAGYAFARYRFPGKQILFFSVLALIMIPGILLVIPMFSLIVDLNWNDTLQGVVLPWTALEVIIGIFLMRTFFETLPQELFEAARLDGADELTLLFLETALHDRRRYRAAGLGRRLLFQHGHLGAADGLLQPEY